MDNSEMSLNIQIPKDANELIHTLQVHGHKAYVVGGCLRDAILGRSPHDWDICTSATPEEMLEIFKGEQVIPTGLQHGTITLMLHGEPYEVTTYRIDGKYTDNRRPDSVTFTPNLVEDLRRRDFTINAMAYNDEEGLLGGAQGLNDIKNEQIRCVGNAKDRFGEDALRILRALRFSAQLGFTIEENTSNEIHKQAFGLSNISMERINSEFCKMAMTPNFSNILREYRDVFEIFIPELNSIFDFPQNNPYHCYDVFEHTLHALEAYAVDCENDLSPQDLITTLAIFFHDIGKPVCHECDNHGISHFHGHGMVSTKMTEEIMRRMKFDNDTREKVMELVFYHDTTFDVGEKHVKRWLNKLGEEQFRRLLVVRRADIKGQSPLNQEPRLQKIDNVEYLVDKVLNEKACFSLKDLAINGKDLINIGYKPGKELGATLQMLLQMVIDGFLPNEKEILLHNVENNMFYFGNNLVLITKEYPIGNLVEIKGVDFSRMVDKNALTKEKQEESTISIGLFTNQESDKVESEDYNYEHE